MESPALISLEDLVWAPFTKTLPVRQASAASLRVLNTLIAQRYLSIRTLSIVMVMMSAIAIVIVMMVVSAIALVVIFLFFFFRRLRNVTQIDAQE